MERHGLDVPVLENKAFAFSSSPDGYVHHDPLRMPYPSLRVQPGLFCCGLCLVVRATRSESRNLDHDGRVSRAREVRYIRRLGIKAAGRKFLEFLLVEVLSVTEMPGSRDNRHDPVIRMIVCLDSRVRRHVELNGVRPRSGGVASEYAGLNSRNARCACPRSNRGDGRNLSCCQTYARI